MAVGIVLALIGGSVAVLFLLVRHEPEDYRRATLPAGPKRKEKSEESKEEFSQLFSALAAGSERDWDIHLTDEQINSYFAEDFKQSHLDDHLLPEGIADPHVLFEPNRIRLAFRYGKGLLSSIISIDFNVWRTPEPNVVALKLDGLRAGSLPIGAKTLLDSLSEMVENNGIQIDWYRHEDGHPVALLRFQSGQNETTMQLQEVKIEQGSITIRGRPVDSSSTHAAVLTAPQPIAAE
jgi:hypothetical protein